MPDPHPSVSLACKRNAERRRKLGDRARCPGAAAFSPEHSIGVDWANGPDGRAAIEGRALGHLARLPTPCRVCPSTTRIQAAGLVPPVSAPAPSRRWSARTAQTAVPGRPGTSSHCSSRERSAFCSTKAILELIVIRAQDRFRQPCNEKEAPTIRPRREPRFTRRSAWLAKLVPGPRPCTARSR